MFYWNRHIACASFYLSWCPVLLLRIIDRTNRCGVLLGSMITGLSKVCMYDAKICTVYTRSGNMMLLPYFYCFCGALFPRRFLMWSHSTRRFFVASLRSFFLLMDGQAVFLQWTLLILYDRTPLVVSLLDLYCFCFVFVVFSYLFIYLFIYFFYMCPKGAHY